MSALKILAAAAIAAALAAPAMADQTGMAGMHTWRKEGKRTCFADHTHFGSSAGMATKAKAEAEAIKSWAEFTAFEYGTDWAQFAKAAGKKMGCTRSTAGAWGCELAARPCR